MELIVESLGRANRTKQRNYFNQPSITIGRAYSNDLIIDDPHVSAHHLELTWQDDKWHVKDLDSLNGITYHGGEKADFAELTELTIGKQRLRFATRDAHVDEAMPLYKEPKFITTISQLMWLSLILLVTLGWYVTSDFLSIFGEFKSSMIINSVISNGLLIAGIAALWSFIGRILKHEPRFSAFLGLWSLLFLTLALSATLFDWLSFNLQSLFFANSVNWFVTIGLTGLALYQSFRLATNIKTKTAVMVTCGMVLIFEVAQWASEKRWQNDFEPHPSYNGLMYSPELLLRQGKQEQAVMEDFSALFTQAEQQAKK